MEKPIFCFTNAPISDELFNILKRLKNNDEVLLSEIESTPEFEMGKKMCENTCPTNLLPGRDEIKKEIIENILSRGSVTYDRNMLSFNGELSYEKQLDIVIGFPASGKSSAVAEKISQIKCALIVDNDEVKKQIPEFNNGWGANRVHEESKKINQLIFQQALKKGVNIVLPKVGGDEYGIKKLINIGKSHGYKVNLHYVELNKNIALHRLLMRFITDGRFLPPSIIYADAPSNDINNIQKTYETIKKENNIDGYSSWNNDVPKSTPPKLIEFYNINIDLLKKITNLDTEKEQQMSNNKLYFRKNRMMCNVVSGNKSLVTKIIDYAKENNQKINKEQLIYSETSKLISLLYAAEKNYLRSGLEFYDNENICEFIKNMDEDNKIHTNLKNDKINTIFPKINDDITL